jgi:hypothetical protein
VLRLEFNLTSLIPWSTHSSETIMSSVLQFSFHLFSTGFNVFDPTLHSLVKFEFGFAISIHGELINTNIQAFDSTPNFEARVHWSGVPFPVRIQLVLIHAVDISGRGRSMRVDFYWSRSSVRFGIPFLFELICIRRKQSLLAQRRGHALLPEGNRFGFVITFSPPLYSWCQGQCIW